MNSDNLKEQFKVTVSIYFALLVGQLLFFAVAFWFSGTEEFTANEELDEIFQIIVPLFGLMMMIFPRFLYSKNISGVDENENVKTKIAKYRTFKIIQWALVESATMFSLIALMTTGNHLYTAVFIFLIGYFFLVKPSKENFVSELKLNSADAHELLNN
jgi:hypothetical protein